MKNKIKNKLCWLLKLCLFNLLAMVALQTHAEYYLVYSAPEYSDSCIYCQSRSHKHHATPKKHHYHRHHRPKSGLYVYRPSHPTCPCNQVWTLAYCQCCPQPNRVRSQSGDYVVFSALPASRNSTISSPEGSSYDPDLSTADDGRADLEIN